MESLKRLIINRINDNSDKIVLKSKDPDKLIDNYLGPFLLMRTYNSQVTIYYQGSYDRIIIPLKWFSLFESLDNICGQEILGVSEPSDKVDKFIYLFLKFSRGTRLGFSYNPDRAAYLLLEELLRLGTTDFMSLVSSETNISLGSWRYEKLDNIVEI